MLLIHAALFAFNAFQLLATVELEIYVNLVRVALGFLPKLADSAIVLGYLSIGTSNHSKM